MNAYTSDSDSNITVHAIREAAREPGVRPLYPYVLFNKSPMQLRLIGARGGRTYGRNLRARRALMPTPSEVAPIHPAAPGQTTAEGIAALDARFPWLRFAEQRRGPLSSFPRARTARHA
jgi:hypothetical protein